MAFQRFEFPDTGLDIEFELLSGLFKIFPHGDKNNYFASSAVSTGEAEEGFIKGYVGPKLPFKKRKQVDDALRRAMATLNYKRGGFQRKRNGRFHTPKKVDLRGFKKANKVVFE